MKKVFFLFMAITATHLFSGNSGAEWSKIYGTEFSESAYSVRATSDGGYIVAGSYGYSILKLFSNGAVEWQKKYTIEPFDQARSIQQTAEGGYIVAGISDYLYWNEKLWILKLNADGNSEWQKTYIGDESPYSQGYDIQQTVDANMSPDGYVAIGRCATGRIWILRLNLDGSLAWQKWYTSGGAEGRSIRQTFDNDGSPSGYVLAGNNVNGLWVVKLNIDGSIGWERTYGYAGMYTRNIFCIRQISDGGYIIVGRSNTVTSGDDVLLARLAADGAIVWQRNYGGEKLDVGFEVLESRDDQNNTDGFVVAGFTESFGAGQSDAWVFKVNGDGNLQWQKTYGGSEVDRVQSLDNAHGGGYIMAGYTWSFDSSEGIWVLRINENGDIPYCSAMGPSQATASDPVIYEPLPYTVSENMTDPTVTSTDAEAEPAVYVMTPMCSLAGDLNMDDAVNTSDLLAFVPGFGTADCGSGETCAGDIDSDNDMDGTDLSIIAKTYGSSN